MNSSNIKKIVLIALLLIALVACGFASTPVASPVVPTAIPTNTATAIPTSTSIFVTDVPTIVPTWTVIPEGFCWSYSDKVCLRWFVGLSTGTDPKQVEIEQALANHFPAIQDKIVLDLEIVPYSAARDALLTEFAADNGPDIIGPVSWHGINAFQSQWMDLKPLLDSYKTSEGQVSLSFAVYPSAIFYNPALFDKVGLAYPPDSYGPNLSPASYRLDGREVEWNWETVREVARRLTLDASGKNVTQPGFDKSKIVQYGFTWNYENQPSYLGTFWGNGAYTATDGKTAQFPAAWKDAWAWTYTGIWGDQPFIPNGQTSASADFDKGNPFNSGKVAMTDQPSWYLCCMANLKWEIGALPAYKGKVAGRVDADFFGIWKGTRNPDEAFQALTYLTTTGVDKLIVGSADTPPAYNAMPSRIPDQGRWLDARKAQFPWVKHWDLLVTNLSFPDSPSAEAYMPNYDKAWARGQRFYDLLVNTSGLDLDQEEAVFLADLQTIFDEK